MFYAVNKKKIKKNMWVNGKFLLAGAARVQT